jgi:hypothetical protein
MVYMTWSVFKGKGWISCGGPEKSPSFSKCQMSNHARDTVSPSQSTPQKKRENCSLRPLHWYSSVLIFLFPFSQTHFKHGKGLLSCRNQLFCTFRFTCFVVYASLAFILSSSRKTPHTHISYQNNDVHEYDWIAMIEMVATTMACCGDLRCCHYEGRLLVTFVKLEARNHSINH